MWSFNFWLNKFYSKVLIIFLCVWILQLTLIKVGSEVLTARFGLFFFFSLELSRNLMFQETIVDRLNFLVWNWYFLPLDWVLFLISTNILWKLEIKWRDGISNFSVNLSRWRNSSEKLAKWIFRVHNSLTKI